MNDVIYIDWDYALAAVKFRNQWRFFYDIETMFLLDYSLFHKDYHPSPGEWRYGALVVDESNAETWIALLSKELEPDQLSRTFWDGTDHHVQPTFLIDFDKKLWVGSGWKMDQTPLADYQPRDWTAYEDDVKKYLPPEVKAYFE